VGGVPLEYLVEGEVVPPRSGAFAPTCWFVGCVGAGRLGLGGGVEWRWVGCSGVEGVFWGLSGCFVCLLCFFFWSCFSLVDLVLVCGCCWCVWLGLGLFLFGELELLDCVCGLGVLVVLCFVLLLGVWLFFFLWVFFFGLASFFFVFCTSFVYGFHSWVVCWSGCSGRFLCGGVGFFWEGAGGGGVCAGWVDRPHGVGLFVGCGSFCFGVGGGGGGWGGGGGGGGGGGVWVGWGWGGWVGVGCGGEGGVGVVGCFFVRGGGGGCRSRPRLVDLLSRKSALPHVQPTVVWRVECCGVCGGWGGRSGCVGR